MHEISEKSTKSKKITLVQPTTKAVLLNHQYGETGMDLVRRLEKDSISFQHEPFALSHILKGVIL